MKKQTVALVIGSLLLVAAGALTIPQLLVDDSVPLMEWNEEDEIDTARDVELEAAELGDSVERTAVEFAPGALIDNEGRVSVVVRGRVVTKFHSPIRDAVVWLEHSRASRRGGRSDRRRVPDPVHTDADGRFAFQGQAFRNLRVSLQVKHTQHAPGMFDRDIGDVAEAGSPGERGSVIDLGDLVLATGGEIIGRVTDLEGNGIAAATVDVEPQGRNRWRWMRNRDEFLPKLTTDNNGYYHLAHVPEGDWSTAAKATQHTEGRSATFATEDDQQTQVDDIRLGPGFEVTGFVLDQQGEPIAKARVSMRSTGGNRGSRGDSGRRDRGDRSSRGSRTHSAVTDKKGRFFMEHLPGVTMRLDVRAEDYLQYQLEEIDPKLGQPIHITMQDGLRIAGTVLDGVDSQPVTVYTAKATRVRGLPVPGLANVDFADLMQRMRSGNLDDATRQQLRTQMESLRSNMGDRGGRDRGGRGDRGRRGGRGSDNNERGRGRDGRSEHESHPGGTFVLTGLQEGIYEVSIESPDHTLSRSDEIEVRAGIATSSLTLRLDRGFYYAGVVVGDDDLPIVGAEVQLRAVTTTPGNSGRGRDGDNGRAIFSAIAREFTRRSSGASLRLEAKTNEDGEFVITHVPAGNYRLSAEADGFAAPEDTTIELLGDRSDGLIVLGTLGSLVGIVHGLPKNKDTEARVSAIRITSNEGGGNGNPWGQMFGRGGRSGFARGNVKADGSYILKDLEPGNYLVRAYIGSSQDIMRQLMPMFMSGELQADVTVKGGETSKLDLQVTVPLVGTVTGSVMHNGTAASGFRVELTAIDNSSAANDTGSRFGRGRRGSWGRNQATVSSNGTFKIENVTAGQYTLRVQSNNRATLHEEMIYVNADATSEHHVTVFTSSLKGTVTTEDGTNPSELSGGVSLMANITELPADYRESRRGGGNGAISARVREGSFEFETVPPGNYLMVLQIRGRERTTAPIVIGTGGSQQTTLPAGKVSTAAPGGPRANQPGGNARGANGGTRRGGDRTGGNGQGGRRNGGGDPGGRRNGGGGQSRRNGGGGRGGR